MSELSDEAKQLIKDSVRIVKEDRHHKMLSELHGHAFPPEPSDPKNNPEGDPGPPPPIPPKDPPKKKSGLWSVGNTEE